MARFHLRSAYSIAALVIPELCPQESDIENFAHRLEFGIPKSALFLLPLVNILQREQIVSLVNAGYLDASSIGSATSEALAQYLSSEEIALVKDYFEGKESV